MTAPELAQQGGRAAHWTVKTNYRLRTAAFINVFVCIALEGWGRHYGALLWGAIAMHLLVYPHVVYRIASRSARSQQAEVDNLTIDCLLFGLLMGVLRFPLWIAFTVYTTSTLNITISRGLHGLVRSQLAFFGGASAAVALFGWNPSPDTGWPCIWLCVCGNAVYFSCIGVLAHRRNQQLRTIREALRANERALTERIAEIQVLRDQLQEQAIRDPLTRLYNRRYLDSRVAEELARCRREAIPLTLMMVDVDHFKKINDTHGHPAGDEVLRILAAFLQQEIRASDTAFRYGGEEFILLLPGMSAATAAARADHWREDFARQAITVGPLAIRATISIGVASFPDHGDSLHELTRCADLALYDAKHGGRNRVVPYRADMAGAVA